MSSSCTCRCAEGRRRRPSAALVVATVALFLSLGGTSYAAVKAGSIGNRQLATDAVSATKIRANAVGTSELANGSVRNEDLRSRSVSGSKIALDAITTQLVLDGSIGSQDLAAGSIGTREVADGSLGTQDLTTDVVGRLLRAPGLGSGGATVDQVLSTSAALASSTEMRGYSVAADQAGTVLVTGSAAVGSALGTDVTCGLVRAGDDTALATSTVTVPAAGRTVVPVQAVAAVGTDANLSLRCWTAPGGTARALAGSTLTVLRVGA